MEENCHNGIWKNCLSFHSIPYHALTHTVEGSHCTFNCWTSSREAVNINFFSFWFNPTGNRTRVYRFRSRRSIHSTTDRYPLDHCFILSKDVEVVKFLWKRKHFDQRDWKRKRTRKRLILSGSGSGSKKFQRWGSGSELGSIKLQEKLEAKELKIWLLSHPWLKPFKLLNLGGFQKIIGLGIFTPLSTALRGAEK